MVFIKRELRIHAAKTRRENWPILSCFKKKKLTMLASQTCNSTTTAEGFLEITSQSQFKLAASSSLKVVTSKCWNRMNKIKIKQMTLLFLKTVFHFCSPYTRWHKHYSAVYT